MCSIIFYIVYGLSSLRIDITLLNENSFMHKTLISREFRDLSRTYHDAKIK